MNDASSISISQNLNIIREQISNAEKEFGRTPGSVKLLAVSKTRPVEDLQAAINAGQLLFGENYLQDALPKIAALPGSLEWHFIGPIQSNKTQPIAQHFNWVHSIDRLKIARRISEQRPPTLEAINICLQVNTSGEASKSGIQPEETLALAKE
ncbi:MAG: YggS family pyridoxal phosphate-dependent enzyme, partial [Gammaproteobacteria bacterium]|nr:YggS family pyridoxal phosphate-dependent enzyme [Gammaproteobacteria bacterium]